MTLIDVVEFNKLLLILVVFRSVELNRFRLFELCVRRINYSSASKNVIFAKKKRKP